MNDSKKPVSTEDLRKALERKAMTLEDIITFVNNELNEWHRRRVLKEKWILKVDVEDLFSVFQADYDKQVHVSRKQLEGIYNDILAKPHSVRLRLKELLEAGLENIPHEKETEKK